MAHVVHHHQAATQRCAQDSCMQRVATDCDLHAQKILGLGVTLVPSCAQVVVVVVVAGSYPLIKGRGQGWQSGPRSISSVFSSLALIFKNRLPWTDYSAPAGIHKWRHLLLLGHCGAIRCW